MMSSKILLLIAAVFMTAPALSQETISTSGSSMSNAAVHVNWTIGDIVGETFTSSAISLTSGFNQPSLKLITATETITDNLEALLYPNPTSQLLNIAYDGNLPLTYKVCTVTGIILHTGAIAGPAFQLDFTGNAPGIFIVELIQANGRMNRYRIVKH